MTFLYKAGIFIYSLIIRLFSVFNEKAKLFVQGRKNWKENLASKIDGQSKYLWFHCSSLGEFEQGRPVIEELKNQFPEYKIVLTFFSPSGYEIRKNYPLADVVAYLPLDTKRNAKTFLEIVQPTKAFFVKYEFWYFYISELKRENIPLYIVSAIFRENQQFFKNTPWGLWYRKLLFKVEHLFVQNEKSGELLESISLSNYTVTGDTRFDRVAAIVKDSKKLPIVEKFKGNSLLIVAGSTWKPDEEILAAFINKSQGIKFIIAAHEVSAANINRIHQLLKKPAISFSKVADLEISKYDVLIIDSVGLLSSLYRYGEIAYIGGGFGVGIHNILEAATFGLPVVFGPNYKKFKEAVDLISEGGAFPVSAADKLLQTLNSLIEYKNKREIASQICANYVAKNVGSTKHIIKKVFNIAPVMD
jgi:3-deoxy-D-manno-octulosonic-acid transferase